MARRKIRKPWLYEQFMPELWLGNDQTFEEEKSDARKLFNSVDDVSIKARARIAIARVHHERSLRRAERQGWEHKHPDFYDYLAHWLVSGAKHEDPEVLAYLQERYPPPEVPMMKPGDSYWRI